MPPCNNATAARSIPSSQNSSLAEAIYLFAERTAVSKTKKKVEDI